MIVPAGRRRRRRGRADRRHGHVNHGRSWSVRRLCFTALDQSEIDKLQCCRSAVVKIRLSSVASLFANYFRCTSIAKYIRETLQRVSEYNLDKKLRLQSYLHLQNNVIYSAIAIITSAPLQCQVYTSFVDLSVLGSDTRRAVSSKVVATLSQRRQRVLHT